MSRDAPIAVLQAAISRVVEDIQDKQKAADEQADFIPAAHFVGAKSGYYFSRGDKGVGLVSPLHMNKPAPTISPTCLNSWPEVTSCRFIAIFLLEQVLPRSFAA